MTKPNVAAEWNWQQDVRTMLLDLIPLPKGRKLSRTFLLLGLVLAKRIIAMKWIAREPPVVGEWWRDVLEWTVAEKVYMKHTKHDEKVEDELKAWAAMLDALKDLSLFDRTETN
ncbi:hypothetical protein NDU88_000716 [Pleurodeles waltl]|uniref:Uncharacterized protein n=1 Tax=Pleurodeles waltl TaxID=8319 RepID=A0AAV7U5S8_PLEWA|nr:hypothetical protein NDU88_000716 [Pleurodeles waltl]